jgi:hypothetical protein
MSKEGFCQTIEEEEEEDEVVAMAAAKDEVRAQAV